MMRDVARLVVRVLGGWHLPTGSQQWARPVSLLFAAEARREREGRIFT